VSGQKMIKMAALQEMYEDLHFIHVETYIQSGNVVFQYQKSDQKELTQKISAQLLNRFGFEIPVIVLEAVELRDIIERNPFISDKTKEISHLHVTFLSSTPKQPDRTIISQKRSGDEEFLLTEKAVYLYCPHGYGRTGLTNTFFENKLKVGATTRNWKTTTELLKIAEKQSLTAKTPPGTTIPPAPATLT
jgi:uncharacterized protein (DUF1697 family)